MQANPIATSAHNFEEIKPKIILLNTILLLEIILGKLSNHKGFKLSFSIGEIIG
ncbi:hypothetical protein APHACPA_0690 [Rickettsia amblyommatis str. Ac/Pa]|uniref:Uncharacterized protein n=1 Tax=Rickettsia amblyommatis str. Ac/Pa TaxID=1359164 RepID=A0A0F3N457_RICAM|nr:hypothetical protein APHACPA_0690 [Rickettsia amblyommatis str. Ac/Pa]